MSLTFKQYNAFLEMPLDASEEQLSEVFGLFKNAEERKKAEMQKLQLLADRGNESAKMKLRKLQFDADKEASAHGASEKDKNDRFASAKAHAEVADRGSSRAYDKETGSVSKNAAPRWDHAQNRWVKPGEDAWAHVGKNH